MGRSELAISREEMSWADPYPSANLFSLIGEIIINFIMVYWELLMITDMFMKSLIFFFFNIATASLALHVLVLNIPKYEWYSTKHWVNYGFSRMSLSLQAQQQPCHWVELCWNLSLQQKNPSFQTMESQLIVTIMSNPTTWKLHCNNKYWIFPLCGCNSNVSQSYTWCILILYFI